MVTVSLVVNQSGKPAGVAGESRDDLALGTLVTVSNDDNSGITVWAWRLISRPTGSAAALSSTSTPSVTFTPDVAGSYLLELKANGRARGRIIAAVKTTRGWRIPAEGEAGELNWWSALEVIFRDANDNIGTGGGGGQTNTVGGTNGITNTGDNVNAVLAPTYGTTSGTVCQGNDSRLSDSRAPTGAAGGDLAGTYPNPTVDGLQGRAVAATAPSDGYVLTWSASGSAWVPASSGGGAPTGGAGGDLSGSYPNPQVSGIRGAPVDPSTAPADGYLLSWDNDGYQWTPVAPGAALGTAGGDLSGSYPDPQVSGIRGAPVDPSTAPVDGYLLSWDNDGYQWTPVAPTGVLDRYIVFADDSEFTETGADGYVAKKTLRFYRDPQKPPAKWRVIATLWVTGGGSDKAWLQFHAGTDDGYASATAIDGSNVVTIDIDPITATGMITIEFRIKLDNGTLGDTAHVKYTELYAVFT